MKKKNEPSATEVAVSEYLTANHIKYVVTGGTATKRDGWDCDAWMIQFSRVRDGKTLVMDTMFYTGTGHRVLTSMGEMELRRMGKATQSYINRVIAEHSRAVAPRSASVLYSLFFDSSSAEQNFHDRCGDFGYDTDSIKAQATYNACCEVLTKMRGFFTGTERTALQELLQDY